MDFLRFLGSETEYQVPEKCHRHKGLSTVVNHGRFVCHVRFISKWRWRKRVRDLALLGKLHGDIVLGLDRHFLWAYLLARPTP